MQRTEEYGTLHASQMLLVSLVLTHRINGTARVCNFCALQRTSYLPAANLHADHDAN